jgi:hypothetical protein
MEERTKKTTKNKWLTQREILQEARRVKNDEFYTRYKDVEKELSMYDKSIWKDKVIFCNCDDAIGNSSKKTSAFALYFMQNFEKLGLKKLICTHYGGGLDVFDQGVKGYVFTYISTKNGFEGIKDSPKKYDGSFDHPISIKILNEEADIVCTNPPFSRAADFWKILIESGKKFLIISNFTNVKNRPYMSYFKENKVWAGHNDVYWFLNSEKTIKRAPGHWYTNLPVINRTRCKNLKIMPLDEIPEIHKKYDDSKILLVNNSYIPSDYKNPCAVSVYPILCGLLEKGYGYVQEKEYVPYINGQKKFGRVLVQKI